MPSTYIIYHMLSYFFNIQHLHCHWHLVFMELMKRPWKSASMASISFNFLRVFFFCLRLPCNKQLLKRLSSTLTWHLRVKRQQKHTQTYKQCAQKRPASSPPEPDRKIVEDAGEYCYNPHSLPLYFHPVHSSIEAPWNTKRPPSLHRLSMIHNL